MKTPRILLLLALASLTGCEGLAVSYTKNFGGQNLTGFVAGDGSYGVIGKKSTGKRVVPTK